MTEWEEVVRIAEEIVHEEEPPRIPVTISWRSGIKIYTWLSTMHSAAQIFPDKFSAKDPDEVVPGSHHDSLLSVLSERLGEATSPEPLSDEDMERDVTVNLSIQEMDFINRRIRPQQGRSQNKLKFSEIPQDVLDNWVFEGEMQLMEAYVSLNKAYIKAGGQARPDFAEFYEGPAS